LIGRQAIDGSRQSALLIILVIEFRRGDLFHVS
jgi:hypothetical protein